MVLIGIQAGTRRPRLGPQRQLPGIRQVSPSGRTLSRHGFLRCGLIRTDCRAGASAVNSRTSSQRPVLRNSFAVIAALRRDPACNRFYVYAARRALTMVKKRKLHCANSDTLGGSCCGYARMQSGARTCNLRMPVKSSTGTFGNLDSGQGISLERSAILCHRGKALQPLAAHEDRTKCHSRRHRSQDAGHYA